MGWIFAVFPCNLIIRRTVDPKFGVFLVKGWAIFYSLPYNRYAVIPVECFSVFFYNKRNLIVVCGLKYINFNSFFHLFNFSLPYSF